MPASALTQLVDFVSVLAGFQACPSLEATRSLRTALADGFTAEEAMLWRNPHKGLWRSVQVNAPCIETAGWWVSSPSASWFAHPMWAHCCNKDPSTSRCPSALIEAPTGCNRRKALLGRCESDATLLCESYLPVAAAGRLVYSFGIANQWTFEDWAASRGFEVHAFDPTTRTRAAHEAHKTKNVHFHFMGLGALRGKAGSLVTAGYGALGGEVLPFDAIRERLGHTTRLIQLLKIDCEGCEWEAFVDAATRMPSVLEKVCTIILEIHVSRTLQMNTTADLRRMAAFWDLYVVKMGFRFWYLHANPGAAWDRTVHPILAQLGLDPSICCYEIGLHRETAECAAQEAVIPSAPAEFNGTASQRSSAERMHAERGRGVFVILAQNGNHSSYGRDSVALLRRTLRYFYHYYNKRERDDVRICHSGDFDAQTQEAVAAGRREIRFLHLKGDNWKVYPEWLALSNRSAWRSTESDGYRMMIRWYAVRIWPTLHDMGYKWVCRLDDDSLLLSEIPFNLFSFMRSRGFDYAYRNVAMERGGWDGDGNYGDKWWEWVNLYVSKMKLQPKWLFEANACRERSFLHENCGKDFFGFYNNFFVANIERFLEPDIQNLLHELDESGLMFMSRWNDLIIQSLAVQLFVPKSRVHRFTSFGYAHNSGHADTLRYGIVQLAAGLPNPERAMEKVLASVLHWPVWLKNNSRFVDGMYTLSRPASSLF